MKLNLKMKRNTTMVLQNKKAQENGSEKRKEHPHWYYTIHVFTFFNLVPSFLRSFLLKIVRCFSLSFSLSFIWIECEYIVCITLAHHGLPIFFTTRGASSVHFHFEFPSILLGRFLCVFIFVLFIWLFPFRYSSIEKDSNGESSESVLESLLIHNKYIH